MYKALTPTFFGVLAATLCQADPNITVMDAYSAWANNPEQVFETPNGTLVRYDTKFDLAAFKFTGAPDPVYGSGQRLDGEQFSIQIEDEAAIQFGGAEDTFLTRSDASFDAPALRAIEQLAQHPITVGKAPNTITGKLSNLRLFKVNDGSLMQWVVDETGQFIRIFDAESDVTHSVLIKEELAVLQ